MTICLVSFMPHSSPSVLRTVGVFCGFLYNIGNYMPQQKKKSTTKVFTEGKKIPGTQKDGWSPTRLFAVSLSASYLYGYSSRRFASYLTASTFAYISPSA